MMEVITIESSVAKKMAEQIEMIAEYVRKSVERNNKEQADVRLVSTCEAAKMLNVSIRTMQRLRDDNRIKYIMVRGHCRYRVADLRRYMEESLVDCSETYNAITHNYSLKRNKV